MKRKLKKIILTITCTFLLILITSCSTKNNDTTTEQSKGVDNNEGIKFKVTADVTGDRAPVVDKFTELIKEKTNGKYEAEVIAAGSLGSESDVAQMLQMGTLDVLMSDDMAIDSVLDGKLGFAWLPGLVANEQEAVDYYDHGWISEQISKIMKENKLIRISSYSNGFRQLGNIVKPVKEMDDISGLKIRTPSVDSVVSFYEKCGALPVMISGSEVLNALQTGNVDGLDNAIFNYTNQGITDVITHITKLNYCYSGGCYIASEKFWDSLNEDDKKIFKDCAQEVSDEFTKMFNEKTDKLIEEGVESGQWTVDEPSDKMKQELDKIYKQIWEESVEKYGNEIMDPIISGEYKK